MADDVGIVAAELSGVDWIKARRWVATSLARLTEGPAEWLRPRYAASAFRRWVEPIRGGVGGSGRWSAPREIRPSGASFARASRGYR